MDKLVLRNLSGGSHRGVQRVRYHRLAFVLQCGMQRKKMAVYKMRVKAGVEARCVASQEQFNLDGKKGKKKRKKRSSFRLPSLHTILFCSRPRISGLILTLLWSKNYSAKGHPLNGFHLSFRLVYRDNIFVAKSNLTSFRTRNVWHGSLLKLIPLRDETCALRKDIYALLLR